MRPHHVLALAGCAGLSAIALTDAVNLATTGGYSVFGDGGPPALVVASDLVHGLTYAALAAVLVRESARFADAGRVARGSRRVLVAAFAAAAGVFVVLAPLLTLTGADPDSAAPAMTVYGIVGTATLLAMVLGAATLGLAVARANPVGIGGRVLLAVLPVLALTVLLGVLVGPDWAHPGWTETTVNVGVALLGVGAVRRATVPAH